MLLVFAVAGPGAVFCQEDGEGQEAWPAVFSDRTEVNIVNVDVVVTDKDGQPVLGLKPEDFLLTADGEAQEISNFFAVEKGEVLALDFVGSGRRGDGRRGALRSGLSAGR